MHGRDTSSGSRASPSTSLQTIFQTLVSRRRMVVSTVGGLLLTCLLYCLIAPRQYEARARVALRTAPASSLSLDGQERAISPSLLSTPVQLETLADVLRSDRLAWRVILNEKLYESPVFSVRFPARFPGFRPESPGTDATSYLLERFQN